MRGRRRLVSNNRKIMYIYPTIITTILLLISTLFFNTKCQDESLQQENELISRGIYLDKADVLRNCDSSFKSDDGTIFTYVNSIGVGCILISLKSPSKSRFKYKTPMVLHIPTFLTPSSYNQALSTDSPGVNDIGAIEVHVVLPSRCINIDEEMKCSDNIKDFGGKLSQMAIRTGLRFLLGDRKDGDGKYITDLIANADIDNVGMFAFSHPGMLLMTTLANWGSYVDRLAYIVKRENPTQSMFVSVELGDADQHSKSNPLYSLSDNYSSDYIEIDYSSVKWDDDSSAPYFDLDDDSSYNNKDFLLGTRVPEAEFKGETKKLYSLELISSIEDKGIILPENIATASELKTFWDGRVTIGNDFDGNFINSYKKVAKDLPNLKQMIVFSAPQHVQNCKDAPTVHQAFDGFNSYDLWVRINPDLEYVRQVYMNSELDYYAAYHPDNDANDEPSDWTDIEDFAYIPKAQGHGSMVALAALAEMIDRTNFDVWYKDDNLDSVIHDY
ncbi:MAG: hypothetical protein HOJ35_07160 [Bdellovibrionales bacterium]|jgi:hypothetical protein|nr:hypothetical protein [Bdellovibrionales bacterium]